MWDIIEVADFDAQIGQVLLVHRNRFVKSFRFSDYRDGRRMDGLVFCVSGRGIFDFGDHRLELLPGQLLFLPAGSAYSVSCEDDDPFIHYTANFILDSYTPRDGTIVSEILSGRHLFVCEAESDRFTAHLEELLSLWQAKRNGYRLMARSILTELLFRYLTLAGRALRDPDGYGKLRAAKKLLDEDFRHDHDIPELSALCGLSETHFRRLWRRLFGSTPSAYLRARRMQRARDLLLSGLYSVSEAAREVGYSDPNYFARIFRQETGITPTEFMRE